LPYIFKDPVKLDKKIDPKKLRFGSKINRFSDEKDKYHKVKEILSPEFIVLDDDLRIRLIGVKPKSEKEW
jgi:site-specific DNA-methyltransferase (adenine-specific)